MNFNNATKEIQAIQRVKDFHKDLMNRRRYNQKLANIYWKSASNVFVKRSFAVKHCADYLRFEVCPTVQKGHTKRLKQAVLCKDRFCTLCNRIRALKILPRLHKRITKIITDTNTDVKLILLTLTKKNVKEIDRDVFHNLLHDYRRFRTSFLQKRTMIGSKHVNLGVLGGVTSLETTYNLETKEYHPHLHSLLVSKHYLDQKKAVARWKEITGDSYIVDIREIKDSIKGVVEVCKYLVKLDITRMDDNAVLELAQALYRVRCLNAFGALKGFMSEEIESEHLNTCSKCNRALKDLVFKRLIEGYVYEI